MKCNIYRDINTSTSGVNCGQIEINIGFDDEIIVYNLSDIQGLVFKDDSRPDYSLFVDTIITSAPFYRINASNISYNETYEDHYYNQEIQATITSSNNEVEEILSAAVHGNYLVALRLIGADDYLLVGWKEGLSLDEELSVSKEDYQYTLTFTGKTTYPKLEADADNFDLSKKVFEPTFEPLFEAGGVVCSNGWAVAKYVVKVNAAGQALDEDNKLCQYSLKPQDAYKLSGVADGGYHIIGTYSSTDFIEGKSVRMFDTSLCEISGSISVSPTAITLNSTTASTAISVTSSDDWELVTYPSTVELSRTNGTNNDQTVYIYGTSTCGTEILTFRNKKTNQRATLTVTNDRITIGSSYTYPYCTQTVTLYPVLCGNYTASSTQGTATVNDDGSFTVSGITCSDTQKTVTVTLVNGSETKQVELIILGNDTARGRRVIAEWCEIE